MLQSRLAPHVAATAHAGISPTTAPAESLILSVAAIRVSSVQTTSVAMDRGSSRRCPGVVTGHIIPLEASVNELLEMVTSGTRVKLVNQALRPPLR
eukprot:UN15091